jgi:hypothetical protein
VPATAVTRITHSCHLIEIGGRTILTDPRFGTRPGYYQGEPVAMDGRAEQVVAELTPHYGAGCPAAVVAYVGQEREIPLRGTLGDIAVQVLAAGVRSTAVIIVGKVLAASGFRDSHLYSAARDRSAQPHS